jgi:hypothetical protein
MKRLLKILWQSLIWAAFVYALFYFYTTEIDFRAWDEFTRFLFTGAALVSVVLITIFNTEF